MTHTGIDIVIKKKKRKEKTRVLLVPTWFERFKRTWLLISLNFSFSSSIEFTVIYKIYPRTTCHPPSFIPLRKKKTLQSSRNIISSIESFDPSVQKIGRRSARNLVTQRERERDRQRISLSLSNSIRKPSRRTDSSKNKSVARKLEGSRCQSLTGRSSVDVYCIRRLHNARSHDDNTSA